MIFFNIIASSSKRFIAGGVVTPPATSTNIVALSIANFEYTTWNQPETNFNNRSAFATTKFNTTGTDIIVGLYTDIDNNSYLTEAKLSIYDDAMNWVAEIAPVVTTVKQLFNITLPSAGTYHIVEGGNTRQTGLTFRGSSLVDLEGSDLVSETITLNNDLVINIGDSISVGDGTSNNSKYGYNILLRKSMPTTDFICDGWGGQNAFNHFYTDQYNIDVANRCKLDFDKRTGRKVILFTLGTNDYGEKNVTPIEFYNKVLPGFNKIIEVIPTVEIIIVSPIIRSNETTLNNGGVYVLDDFRTKLQEIATATAGVTYYEGKTILELTDLADGIHPTEAGHIKMATAIETLLEQPIDTTAPTITTARVEDANPDKLVLVFSEVVNITDVTGLTITGDVTPTLSAPTGTGTNTITFTLSAALTNGQSVTLDVAGTNTITDAVSNALAATTKAITNYVAEIGGGYILDTYSAAVAYSLRKLSGGYTGAAIRVRRSSDDTEQDIGFDGNNLDTTSLLSFVGAGNGLVTTIYDQSGAGLNFTQTNLVRQGRIVNSGVVNTLNGKPVILRSVDNNGGYTSTYAPNDGVVVKGVFYVGNNDSKSSILLGSFSSGNDFVYVSQSGSTSTTTILKAIVSNEKLNGATWVYSNRGDIYTDTINQFLVSNTTDFNFDINSLTLGYNFSNPANLGMFSFQELIIFANTTDHLDKETKINSYYSIY